MTRHIIRLLLLTLAGSLAGCTPNGEDASMEDREVRWVEIEEGTHLAAALSPDGEQIGMALQGSLWLLPVEGGEATPLTGPGVDALEPSWSPDGQSIVFYSYVGHYFQISRYDLQSGEVRVLTDGAHDHREPSWSPDGAWIHFVTDRSGPYDIWRIPAEGGGPEPVLETDSDLGYPALSPDGESLAYVDFADGGSLVIRDSEGERYRGSPDGRPAAPSWSPDGSRIHVTYFRRGVSEAAVLDRDRNEWTRVDRGGEDLYPFRVSWLSDEEWLVAADGGLRIESMTGDAPRTIPFRALMAVPPVASEPDGPARTLGREGERPVRGVVSPTLSPDGERIAYAALGDVWIQDLEGELEQLTETPWVELDVTWAPDGERVAYTADPNGSMQLWVRDLESGEEQLLAPELDRISSPAWSWSGDWIAFLVHTRLNKWGGATLYRVHVESGRVERLHDPLFSPGEPSWTPDDQSVALLALDRQNGRYREGANRIRMVPVDGSDPFWVSLFEEGTLGMRSGSGPVWSGRGDELLVVRDGRLWRAGVTSSGEVVTPPEPWSEDLLRDPSWSRDGTLMARESDRFRLFGPDGQEMEPLEPTLGWQPHRESGIKVVRAGRLFNGVDDAYQEQVDIVIEGNRIVRVEPARPGRPEVVIDASDAVVLPGLFEMHTHQNSMEGERLGRTWLSYGITSVREPGSDPYDGLERRESWSSGARPGPRLFTTGGLTDGLRVYYGLANPVADRVQLDKELDRAESLELDLMKSYVRFPDSLQQQMAERTDRIGIPLSSHELYPAIRFGVESVEHLRGTSRRGYSLKQTARNRSYGDVVDLLAASGMSVTPTVVMHGGYWLMADRVPELLDHRQLRALLTPEELEDLQARAANSGYGQTFGDEGETEPGAIQDAIRRIHDAGGVVTAGTDSPFVPFGSSLHAELWLYVDAGLTPAEALRTATLHAADAAGVGDLLGSIEAGKRADLVIVEGDPLANIEDAMRVRSVMKGGAWMPLDSLLTRDSMLPTHDN